MVTPLTHSESIFIAAPPHEVYAVVSDITRTGEWSPVCKACWWDSDENTGVGAWFTGRNETPDRSWETRSQITVADENSGFGWSVGPDRVNWTYSMREVEGGTELTESWEFTVAGQEYFVERFGEDAETEISSRKPQAEQGIHETLLAMKRTLEQG